MLKKTAVSSTSIRLTTILLFAFLFGCNSDNTGSNASFASGGEEGDAPESDDSDSITDNDDGNGDGDQNDDTSLTGLEIRELYIDGERSGHEPFVIHYTAGDTSFNVGYDIATEPSLENDMSIYIELTEVADPVWAHERHGRVFISNTYPRTNSTDCEIDNNGMMYCNDNGIHEYWYRTSIHEATGVESWESPRGHSTFLTVRASVYDETSRDILDDQKSVLIEFE